VILSETEIKEYLGLDEVSDKLAAIEEGIESWVKGETRRKFEQATYTEYPTIYPGQDEIILSDAPATAISTFSTITDIDDDGTETLEAYNAGDYYLDEDKGIISMLRGAWLPPGRHTVKLVYTAGFTIAQFTAGELDDIRILKLLLKTLLAREYALAKDDKRHVASISYGDESTTYRFALDATQKSLLYKLQRKTF